MKMKLKSLAIQTLFELDKNADENWRSSKQFSNGEVLNILKDFVAVYQQQAVSDEEIEKLAEKEYPYGDGNLKQEYGLRDLERQSYIKGFKSALQYTKSSVGDSELLKEKDGQIKELKDALDVALLVIKQNNAVTKQ